MKKILFIFIVIVLVTHGVPLYAQDNTAISDTFDVRKNLAIPGGDGPFLPGPDASEASQNVTDAPILKLITEVINFLVAIITSFSILVFIAGGLLLIVAEGQDDRIQKGKQAMVFSLIGLVVALMAYVITTAVQAIFF